MPLRQRSWLLAATIATVAVVFAGLSFLLPVRGGDDPLQVHIRAAVAVIIAVLSAGAAIWFLSGLGRFKKDLQTAYRLLAIGVGLWGLSLLQLPIVGLFDLWNSWWGNSGALIVPFMVASLLIYLGMRKFARLMRLQSHAISVRKVLGVTLVVMALSAVAAHYLVRHPFEGVETFTATIGWSVTFLGFSAFLAYRISQTIGQEYRHAMHWLTGTLAALTLACTHEYVINFFLAFESPYLLYGLSLLPFVIAELLSVQASRSFYLLTSHTSEDLTTKGVDLHDQDYVDNIVLIVALASQPKDIDPILDALRTITAKHKSVMILTEKDKQQLMHVYHQLETYLLTNEPLRNFSQEELRQRISPAFRAQLEK